MEDKINKSINTETEKKKSPELYTMPDETSCSPEFRDGCVSDD